MKTLLSTSVASLKGIGENRQKSLERLGVQSVWDLLLHLPFRYEDRSTIVAIASLQAKQQVVVQGMIDSCSTTRGRKPRFDCHISDSSGSIVLRFFNHYPGQQQRFASGQKIRCYGRVGYGQDGLEFIHPEYDIISANAEFDQLSACLSPVYPLVQGLTQQVLRQAVEEALERLAQCNIHPAKWLAHTEQAYQTLSLHKALSELHFPLIESAQQRLGPELNNLSIHPARQRLALEELLVHRQQAMESDVARHNPAICRIADDKARTIIDYFVESLEFKPTNAQTRAVNEILSDLFRDSAMCRLLQGDVGSGKTLVAACAALPVLQAGAQVALLAPTELLAEQHLFTFQTWFSGLQEVDVKVMLLKGGQSAVVRQQLLDAIQSGSANLVIGTHALLQENVRFHKLGLIVIDEQHRFGVEQRALLIDNNLVAEKYPHQLIMTATPIPRTLALLQYAGMAVSQLDELPAGRLPVATVAMSKQRRSEVIQRIHDWVAQGKQVYWVCTVIEETDQSDREALHAVYTTLCSELPTAKIEYLHGKLSAQEKQDIMSRFREHKFDVLVATTVIEVGVDVGNANLMVIEDADMLGLAQLHQLRGRVGRGEQNGYCVLLYQPPLSEIAKQRLGLLRKCNNGFEIAEQDLQLRGPGELAGLRQSGSICFRVADLAYDEDLLVMSQQILEQMNRDKQLIDPETRRRWITTNNAF